MRSEAACARRLPLVLSVVLAVGCTTKVVNLAASDGGAEKANAAREDASADRGEIGADREDASVAPEDASVAPEDASVAPKDAPVAPEDASVAPKDAPVAPEDAGVDREEADDASTTHLKEAYDAGVVPGPGHYVNYKCCRFSDAGVDLNKCIEKSLGGPEICNSASQWKDRAYTDCSSMDGFTLGDYRLFGAC